VRTSPWIALAVDLAALSALFSQVALDGRARVGRRGVSDAAAFLGGFALTAGLWLVAIYVFFGTTEAARAALRGDAVFLEPTVLDFGSVPAGTDAERILIVRNAGSADLRLIGGTSSCACTVILDRPARVTPGDGYQLRVRLNVPADPGLFQIHAVLWTDSAINETLPVVLRGRSVEP
jgi:hypothetical protein